METKTIKALIPPPEDKKWPSTVKFEDGTEAKYWPTAKFGAQVAVGVTAECVIEEVVKGGYTNRMLTQWGDKVSPRTPGGFQGRPPMSPEERRSIAVQACIKAAAEVCHGTSDGPTTAKIAAALVKLHDHLVSEGAKGGA